MTTQTDLFSAVAPAVTSRPITTISDKGRPLMTLNFMIDMARDMLGKLIRMRDQHGDTFMFQMAGMPPNYVFTRPEHVRDILITNAKNIQKDVGFTDTKIGLARWLGSGLLTSEGTFWRRQRKMIAPAFHAQRVSAYAETMAQYTGEMLATWQDGQTRDIAHEMADLTLNVISETMLHSVNRADTARIARAMRDIQEAFGPFGQLLPAWFPLPSRLRAAQGGRDLDEIVYRIIRERRADPTDRGDLLSMMMLTEGDDGERMTDRELRDEAVTLFLAGHETTANTLNWTFRLLAKHPEIEAKLHAELDSVLGGRLPTLADLRRLPYTEMVIKESMRLYPPAWSFSREAVNDMNVDGYHIPKGSMIVLSQSLTHRHPDFWADPDRFDPERFSPANEPNIEKWAYFPFGGGQRVCIGQSFAMLEAVLLLAGISSQYKLRLAPTYRDEAAAVITLYPKYGLPMTLHKR